MSTGHNLGLLLLTSWLCSFYILIVQAAPTDHKLHAQLENAIHSLCHQGTIVQKHTIKFIEENEHKKYYSEGSVMQRNTALIAIALNSCEDKAQHILLLFGFVWFCLFVILL